MAREASLRETRYYQITYNMQSIYKINRCNLNSGNGSTNSLKEANINKITKENSDKEQYKLKKTNLFIN